tara:strand:+ start:530 stop:1870 length:1341 start_codon:yes stop_codon:yes gene_type:complete
MRRHFHWLNLFILCFVLFSCKTEKIIESSLENRPNWVYGLEHNHLIVQGIGADHAEAKNKALVSVKEKIVESVAVNVSSTVQIDINEKTINEISQYQEITTIQTQISSDFMKALNGISLNKASEYYWEQIKNRETGEVYIAYHIKYPFTESELNNLVAEWQALDKELSLQITSIEKEAHATSDLKKLMGLYAQISKLETIFNEPKKTQAGIVKAELENLFNDLNFFTYEHTQGELVVQVKGNGKTYYNIPSMDYKSDCAHLLDMEYHDDIKALVVHYDPEFCDPMKTPMVNLKMKINNQSIAKNFEISFDEDIARIALNGEIRLIPIEKYSFSDKKWQIPIRAYTDFEFRVVQVDMTIDKSWKSLLSAITKRQMSSVVMEDLNQKFDGKGDFMIEMTTQEQISGLEEIMHQIMDVHYTASGKIVYTTNGSDRELVYRFHDAPLRVY